MDDPPAVHVAVEVITTTVNLNINTTAPAPAPVEPTAEQLASREEPLGRTDSGVPHCLGWHLIGLAGQVRINKPKVRTGMKKPEDRPRGEPVLVRVADRRKEFGDAAEMPKPQAEKDKIELRLKMHQAVRPTVRDCCLLTQLLLACRMPSLQEKDKRREGPSRID